MRISGSSLYVSGHTLFATRPSRTTATADPGKLTAQLRRVDEEVRDLANLLEDIRGHASSSSTPFALGRRQDFRTGTPAVLESAAEVNTEATQLSTRTPQWTGPGGRTVGIGGVYSGTTDDTLTFKVRNSTGRFIDVTNSAGTLLDTVRLDGSGNQASVATVFGLTVHLGAGALTKDDTFSLQVTASQDGAIDRADAFNGVGNASARFEEGTVITAGQFQVNGTTIAVAANDSLNDVLARITAQVAGVTASYDEATEKVRIVTDDTGVDQALEITGDTSGLIAALKLDGLGRVTGGESQQTPNTRMSQLIGYEAVTAGTLTINGTSIAIDPATQTLQDVMDALNEVDGVIASLDSLGQLRIGGDVGTTLTLGDDSGFLKAVGIVAGVRKGREGQRRISEFSAERIATEIGQLREALDDVMDGEGFGVGASLRIELAGAIGGALEEAGLDRFGELTGLTDFDADTIGSRTKRVREVRATYGDFRKMMIGEQHRNVDGLLDRIDDIVDGGLAQLNSIDALA